MRRTDLLALINRAQHLDAGVAAKRSLLGGDGGDEEPHWAVRAQGCHLYDERGRPYLDLLLGFGSVVLGHAHPLVTEAVIAALRRGVTRSLRVPEELELVELLTRVVPNAEGALLLRTGSDATAAAVRLARAATGRPRLLRSGYQGWHDWCAPRSSGIPTVVRDLTTTLPFGDADAVRAAFDSDGDTVAALVVMAADGPGVGRDYLAECRRLTREHGSVLVLDEVRTGFRLALGGAQEYYGVDADLVALSKALGNGHPISAVTGSWTLLRAASDVSLSSVYFRSADGPAAGLATIGVLQNTDALDVVHGTGRALLDGIAAGGVRAGVPVRAVGLAPMPGHVFDLEGDDLQRAEEAFYTTAWANGLLVPRTHHWLTCAALTDDDVRFAVDVVAASYKAVAARL